MNRRRQVARVAGLCGDVVGHVERKGSEHQPEDKYPVDDGDDDHDVAMLRAMLTTTGEDVPHYHCRQDQQDVGQQGYIRQQTRPGAKKTGRI